MDYESLIRFGLYLKSLMASPVIWLSAKGLRMEELLSQKKQKKEERKWEDMPTDCLVNIFARLGVESRLLDIPLVCKSWYMAVYNPLSWKRIVFPTSIDYSRLWGSFKICTKTKQIFEFKLIKFAVDQSEGCAISLVLPDNISSDDLIYVSEECPALKMLALPASVCDDNSETISEVIANLKNLEFLSLGCSFHIAEIAEVICNNLPNFMGLRVTGGHIDDEIASAIASHLPNIKYLVLRNIDIKKKNLLVILKGCKQLVKLDIRNCIGFDEYDQEILKLSSAIKKFRCEGSMVEEYETDDYDIVSVSSNEYYADSDDYETSDDLVYGDFDFD